MTKINPGSKETLTRTEKTKQKQETALRGGGCSDLTGTACALQPRRHTHQSSGLRGNRPSFSDDKTYAESQQTKWSGQRAVTKSAKDQGKRGLGGADWRTKQEEPGVRDEASTPWASWPELGPPHFSWKARNDPGTVQGTQWYHQITLAIWLEWVSNSISTEVTGWMLTPPRYTCHRKRSKSGGKDEECG